MKYVLAALLAAFFALAAQPASAYSVSFDAYKRVSEVQLPLTDAIVERGRYTVYFQPDSWQEDALCAVCEAAHATTDWEVVENCVHQLTHLQGNAWVDDFDRLSPALWYEAQFAYDQVVRVLAHAGVVLIPAQLESPQANDAFVKLSVEVGGLTTRVESLSKSVEVISDSNGTLASQITALSEAVARIEKAITTPNTTPDEVSALQTQVQELEKRMDEFAGALAQLQTQPATPQEAEPQEATVSPPESSESQEVVPTTEWNFLMRNWGWLLIGLVVGGLIAHLITRWRMRKVAAQAPQPAPAPAPQQQPAATPPVQPAAPQPAQTVPAANPPQTAPQQPAAPPPAPTPTPAPATTATGTAPVVTNVELFPANPPYTEARVYHSGGHDTVILTKMGESSAVGHAGEGLYKTPFASRVYESKLIAHIREKWQQRLKP